MRKLSRQITLLATTLLASASLNTPIFAADTSSSSSTSGQTISGQVDPGSLTMSASLDSSSPKAQTLNGTSNLQFTTGGGAITITDARGTGAGYKLSVSATPLSFKNDTNTNGVSRQSSISNITATTDKVSVQPANTSASMGAAPDVKNTITNFVGTTGTIATAASNTENNQGMGSFVITLPSYTFTIPASAYAGTYSSTITYTLSDSPQ
ncbi:WxL domain-containing protein [Ligilactobacillus equi]